MNDDDLGRLEQRGDDWTITFTRRLKHPVEKVWRAVTEEEHLAAWFPDRVVGNFEPGAALRFEMQTGDSFDGKVIQFEPQKILELAWGPDTLRIELQPDGDGTLLTLVDTFHELGKAARDGAGWHECVERLVAHVDGTTPPKDGAIWKTVHPVYQERFGPEASTIGVPEGYELPDD
jgi:uncharacterized protein YndB with AHSA1/START domain